MACDVQKEAAFARGTAGNVFTNNLAIVTSAIQICNLCQPAIQSVCALFNIIILQSELYTSNLN